MLFIFWIILSIIVGAMGSSRKIGFGWALVASLFLSPLIGAIIVLNSERNSDAAYKEKMLRYMSGEPNTPSEAELNSIRETGFKAIKDLRIKSGAANNPAAKIVFYVIGGLLLLGFVGIILSNWPDSERTKESETRVAMSPKEDLLYRIKNDMEHTRDEIEATFTVLGTLNTRVDGIDVGHVNLWSTTGKNRKINASLKNRTEVCIMGEEDGYLLVGTIKSPIFEWGYCMDGFVER